MDNDEARAARTASAISLPTVAWQAAGEEPAGGATAPEPGPGAAHTGARSEPGTAPARTGPEAVSEPETAGVTVGGATQTLPDRTGATTPGSSGAAAPDGEAEAAGQDTPASGREGEQQAAPDVESLAAAATTAATPRAGSRPAKRLSKPLIAAAATSGVVLMGVPLLFSQLGGGSGPSPVPPRPAGYSQADGGSDGFVPGIDAPEKGSSLPGAAAPGAAGDGREGSPGTANMPLPKSAAGLGAGTGVGSGADGSTPTSSHSPGTQPSAAPGEEQKTVSEREAVSTPGKAAAPPAKNQYAAVAGPGCAGSGASFDHNGWYTDGKEGWRRYGSGGYSGSGCDGGFYSLPMSGSASKDAGNSLRWTFRTGSVTSGTCQVSVHIPSNSDIKAVGGKPSYYTVHAGATGNEPILRSFTVNQTSQQGRWISAGSVTITHGQLTVKLHDRGLDWSGSQKTYAHHAGDAARVECTAS